MTAAELHAHYVTLAAGLWDTNPRTDWTTDIALDHRLGAGVSDYIDPVSGRDTDRQANRHYADGGWPC